MSEGECVLGWLPSMMGVRDERTEREYAIKKEGLWYIGTVNPAHGARFSAATVQRKIAESLVVLSDWTKNELSELDAKAVEVLGGDCYAKQAEERERR